MWWLMLLLDCLYSKKPLRALAKARNFLGVLLMGIATIGAFAIGEYPEGVAVMLFMPLAKFFRQWLFQEQNQTSNLCSTEDPMK